MRRRRLTDFESPVRASCAFFLFLLLLLLLQYRYSDEDSLLVQSVEASWFNPSSSPTSINSAIHIIVVKRAPVGTRSRIELAKHAEQC
jgi:hypothetical protein